VRAPDDLAKYIAPKGSVALNGVSLTVNEVRGSLFTINLIPATLEATTFGEKKAGDAVNLEADVIARYVARILGQ
jgi:riboflavin synthase